MSKSIFFAAILAALFISPSHGSLSSCPGFAQTGKARLVAEAQCGHLKVPLSDAEQSVKDSPTLALNIVRWPSISTAPEADPLFVLAGGPGQAATDIGRQLQAFLMRVRKKRDIIFVDQRGTGDSHPLMCQLTQAQDGMRTDAQMRILMAARLDDCFAELFNDSIKPEYFSTAQAAKDIDRVRKYLGYERINLWGGSYGTRLALAYARDFPLRLRTMVLDGVAPASMRLPQSMGQDLTQSFELFIEDCAQQNDCANLGDITEQLKQLVARLAKQPETIEQRHPRTGQPSPFLLTPQKVLGVVRMSLYSRETAVMLPWSLAQANEGNYQPLATLLAMIEEGGIEQSIALGLHYAIICHEDWQGQIPKTNADELFSRLGVAEGYQMACETLLPEQAKLKQGSFSQSVAQNTQSDVPTLLLSGRRDPVTPPSRAQQAAKTLSNSRHLIAPGGHHIISTQGCVPRLIETFINTANAQAIDAECVDAIKPMSNFVSPVWIESDKGTAKTTAKTIVKTEPHHD